MSITHIIEAKNRAEVTTLLLSRGYMLYRPEADIDGIDFVLATPGNELLRCQLKSRAFVQKNKYGQREIWMVFPGPGPDFQRMWYLIPHDVLFQKLKERHGHAPKWRHPIHGEYWHTPVNKELAEELSHYRVIKP
jgi:hypothetical protein